MTNELSVDIALPRIALAIGAHPDDIEFQCGATLAKWARSGCSIHLLILTDGSKGSWNPQADRGTLVDVRRSEARSAACLLGAEPAHVVFLDSPDGELSAGTNETVDVCSVIRSVRPDAILGHDPWKRYRLHPDHRAAGFITVDALVAAREPHFTAGQTNPPHRPTSLLLFEADQVDHIEDVQGFEEHKVAALLAHESQYPSTMNIKDVGDARGISRFREWVLDDLSQKGSLADRSAGEAFKLITDL